MKHFRAALAATVLLSISSAAAAAEPFDAIQGMWYDMNHKVAVELVDRKLIVREIDTKDITINKHNWMPGTVIAIYGDPKQDRETFRFSGQCWDFASNTLVEPCLDNAVHFDRRGTKPFWAMHAAGLTLWRKEKFSKSDWSSRD
jgi:hypothetical protein